MRSKRDPPERNASQVVLSEVMADSLDEGPFGHCLHPDLGCKDLADSLGQALLVLLHCKVVALVLDT